MTEKKRPSVKKRRVASPNRTAAAQETSATQAKNERIGSEAAREDKCFAEQPRAALLEQIPNASERMSTGALASAGSFDTLAFEGFEPDDAVPDAEEGSHSHAKRGGRPSVRGRGSAKKKLLVVVAIIVALLVALAVVFSLDRWARDDASAFVGDWYANGSEKVIPISEDKMVLAYDAVYTYQLDTTGKTINFNLAKMEGQGRYCFFDGGDTLVIIDGEYSFFQGIRADFVAKMKHFITGLFMDEGVLPSGDNVVIFRRVPAPEPEAPAAEAAPSAEGEAEQSAEAAEEDDGEDAYDDDESSDDDDG